MRRLLIVCYDYPSIHAAGVIRTYQLAKNLVHFGWEPIILTAQPCVNSEHNIETSDGALECRKISAAAARFLTPVQNTSCSPSPAQQKPGLNGHSRWQYWRRFASKCAVPDGKIGWTYQAVKRGIEIASKYPIHVCFSVSPRPTAHLVGHRLSRRLNLPWVADFTLPWSDAPWLNGRPSIAKWLDERLERQIVRSARHLTVAYSDLAHALAARHGRTPAEITVIPTGYNEDLFVEPTDHLPRKLTVIYPGNHFCEEDRHGEVLLKAIDEWVNSNPALEDRVEFIFVGKKDEALLRHRAAMTHFRVIRIEPPVSHRACVQAILASHACIVNTVGNRIPAKLYECMRAGKWVLALTSPGSDLAGIVNNYSNGIVVAARNRPAIRHALQTIWSRYRAGAVNSMQSNPAIARYSSRQGATLLAAIFDRLSRDYEPVKRPIQPI